MYDPALGGAEAQFKKSMVEKHIGAERSRPDPLMWARRWQEIISSQGAVYAAVIDDKIKEHNLSPDAAVRFSDGEKYFMQLQSP